MLTIKKIKLNIIKMIFIVLQVSLKFWVFINFFYYPELSAQAEHARANRRRM